MEKTYHSTAMHWALPLLGGNDARHTADPKFAEGRFRR